MVLMVYRVLKDGILIKNYHILPNFKSSKVYNNSYTLYISAQKVHLENPDDYKAP